MKEVLKIDSVFLEFDNKQVLRGACLELAKHRITGLLGRNGSGKSCFMQVLTGQLASSHKHLTYNGRFVEDLFKQKGLANYLPQFSFHPKSATLKQLLYFYNIPTESFLERNPFLKPSIAQKFSHISGGEQRLIEVLLVLEADTTFSLLDEPFTYIMPKYVDLIKERIVALSSQKGFLITDHQYRHILELSDELYLMDQGRLQLVQEEDLQEYGYLK
ncbi:MAG: ATP-binding cassette domain-containing protein [Bacteroidota bacterium]